MLWFRLFVLVSLMGTPIAFTMAEEFGKSYPISMKPTDVHQFDQLKIEFNGITIQGSDMIAVPIRCKQGITGAMLIGSADFQYEIKKGDPFAGKISAVMLRFSPKDQASVLPLGQANKVKDLGSFEIARHLLDNVFKHCWHRGKEALIPPKGALAANIYSKEHGDVLVSVGDAKVVHNFTQNKTIHQSGK